jgi:hypothetical protein
MNLNDYIVKVYNKKQKISIEKTSNLNMMILFILSDNKYYHKISVLDIRQFNVSFDQK